MDVGPASTSTTVTATLLVGPTMAVGATVGPRTWDQPLLVLVGPYKHYIPDKAGTVPVPGTR